jgi:hydrogenase-4 component E
MDHDTYTSLLSLAAAALVLTAVLVVWRRGAAAITRLLAWQGGALAAIPIVRGAHGHDTALIVTGAAVLVLRAVVLPWLLARAVAGQPRAQREAAPLVNTASSLLITAVVTIAAFAVTRPLTRLEPDPAAAACPAGFAVIFIGLFVMTTRRHAVSQAAGFLAVDNGIAATAFLLTAGVPAIVEFGASLDILFAVIVLGVLTGRLRRAFGDADLDQLQELHD